MELIFLILLIAGASLIWYSIRFGITPMPTSFKVKRKLLETLPKEDFKKIYELGSGWGTLAKPLAERYQKAHVIGLEISWVPYLFSLLKQTANLKFLRQDFFTCDLSEADLVVCYLYPDAMRRLAKKFDAELGKETVVISHTFAIPGKKPEKTLIVDDLYVTKIYFYRY